MKANINVNDTCLEYECNNLIKKLENNIDDIYMMPVSHLKNSDIIKMKNLENAVKKIIKACGNKNTARMKVYLKKYNHMA